MKICIKLAVLILAVLSVQSALAFTALCPTGSPPAGQIGPSSNLLHISVWNSAEGLIFTDAHHDTLWFQGGFLVAEYESGPFNPDNNGGSYFSWIASQPMEPIFLTNTGETTMRFFTSGGGPIPPGWFNLTDDCEGAGVVF